MGLMVDDVLNHGKILGCSPTPEKTKVIHISLRRVTHQMPSCQVNGARTQTVCKNSGWRSDSNFYSFVVAEMVPCFIIQNYFLTLNVRVQKKVDFIQATKMVQGARWWSCSNNNNGEGNLVWTCTVEVLKVEYQLAIS